MDFAGDGSRIRKVRYYFAAPDAKINPYLTPFVSANWQAVSRQNTGLGETWWSEYRYNKGAPLPGASGKVDPCGPPDWWLYGVPADAPDLTLTTGGLPTCCAPQPGLLLGGTGYPGYRKYDSGGLYLGGVSRYGYIHYSAGGLLLGGIFAVSPPMHSSLVGVLLGGTSSQRIVHYSTAGLELGGTTRPGLVNQSRGGLQLGGTDVPTLVVYDQGGVEFGAIEQNRVGPLGVCNSVPRVMQLTLNVTNRVSQTFPVTFTLPGRRWLGTDPQTGLAVSLALWGIDGVQGLLFLPLPAHCTQTVGSSTGTCEPLSQPTLTVLTGSLCVFAGHYPWVITD